MPEAEVADSIARQVEMLEFFSSLQVRHLCVVNMAIGEIKFGKRGPVFVGQRIGGLFLEGNTNRACDSAVSCIWRRARFTRKRRLRIASADYARDVREQFVKFMKGACTIPIA